MNFKPDQIEFFGVTYKIININSPLELESYPSTLGETTCNVKINFIVTNFFDQSGPPNAVLVDNHYLVNLTDSFVRNETSAIYNYNIEISNGTFTSNLTIPRFPDSMTFINYSCNYVDVSKLSVSFIKDITYNERSYFSAVFKLNGLPRPLILTNTEEYSFTKISNTFQYRIEFNINFVTMQTTPNWKVTLPINGDQFSFNLTYKYETTPTILDNEITDITFYPNETDYSMMTYYYGKIIKFKLKKANITNIPYFGLESYYSVVVRPILGSLGNIEYIASCLGLPGYSTYNFYLQNGQPGFSTFNFSNNVTNVNYSIIKNVTFPIFDNKTIPFFTTNAINNNYYDFKEIGYEINSQRLANEKFPYGFSGGNNLKYN
ncbi:hypothetical protein ACTA71_011459 [Dictyostelium dimigraforme]